MPTYPGACAVPSEPAKKTRSPGSSGRIRYFRRKAIMLLMSYSRDCSTLVRAAAYAVCLLRWARGNAARFPVFARLCRTTRVSCTCCCFCLFYCWRRWRSASSCLSLRPRQISLRSRGKMLHRSAYCCFEEAKSQGTYAGCRFSSHLASSTPSNWPDASSLTGHRQGALGRHQSGRQPVLVEVEAAESDRQGAGRAPTAGYGDRTQTGRARSGLSLPHQCPDQCAHR